MGKTMTLAAAIVVGGTLLGGFTEWLARRDEGTKGWCFPTVHR
ncbi:MAG: hypothetical protein NTY19_42715 [Planctomycetota bacterium]|nr:hypothetical protein [Planctomycetota bacterium]